MCPPHPTHPTPIFPTYPLPPSPSPLPPPSSSLRVQVHDISLELQNRLEALGPVERAFVHVVRGSGEGFGLN
jgi:hypothetical protein